MNNYYTLIYLTEHLKNKLTGSVYRFSTSPHRNVWEGYFEAGGETVRLVFSTHPGEITLFSDRYRPAGKKNTLTFFDDLTDRKVTDISLSEGDRLITLTFSDNDHLMFQLFGNRANLYRISEDLVSDRFKESGRSVGRQAPEPAPAPHLNPDTVYDESITEKSAAQLITLVDRKFPRHLIERVIEQYELEEAPPERVAGVIQTLTDTMQHSAEFHVTKQSELSLVPSELLSIDPWKSFDSVNEAIRECYYRRVKMRRFGRKKESLMSALESASHRTSKTVVNLEDSQRTLQRADEHEKKAHLLMANAHIDHPDGRTSISLSDLYSESQKIDVPLKPDLNLAENAERYYRKAAKARREAATTEKRRRLFAEELTLLKRLINTLNDIDTLPDLENWEDTYSGDLQKLNIFPGSEQKSSPPFRKTGIDGFECWIGKNAKSNDEVTRQAHKEDIWLHARGSPGSHVVIRMNNNKEFPPQHVLLRAAAFAAWYSRQRGADLVPVIITKRKYVTKPKNSAAGTVRIQKEKVELVTPIEP